MRRAPLWRRTGANLVDMAWFGGLLWLARSRGHARDGGRLTWLLALPGDPLREQLRSPGQRLLGIRTVDRRTGRRLALWRTLGVLAAAVAGQALAGRLGPAETPEREREREDFRTEMEAIMRRHPQASAAREAERDALLARHPGTDFARTLAPVLLTGLLTTRLRRRLAPTVEVLARARAPHNP
ncbi:MAG TPA: hypothetical protein VNV44_00635 [Solirubrobacteraceae bacterium]|nr:hypothetical protein [Solirubrobacteraceae bacterium]